MTAVSREHVTNLAVRVANGDHDAFTELEGVARPLLVSLSYRFSNYHHRFEFDDFYSIGRHAMYKACLSFNPANPSFLDYAKVIILREFWKEFDYWNAIKRTVFSNDLSFEGLIEDGFNMEPLILDDTLADDVYLTDFKVRIENLIAECFEKEKADIMRMYLLQEKRVMDISNETGLKYKNVHSTVMRGIERIRSEYNRRYLDETL